MAGMISFLHKSQLRLDSGSGAATMEDSGNDYRKPCRRSPASGRRILALGHGMKTLAGPSDRLPKRFRKKRCNEIHPLLRRSVCTLIMAGAGLMAGITILLVDHYMHKEISRAGIIVSSISLCFIILGIAWLCWSTAQLRKLREKILEKQAERENRQGKGGGTDQFYTDRPAHDPASLSAAKWPMESVIREDSSKSRRLNSRNSVEYEGDIPYNVPTNSRKYNKFNQLPSNMSGTSLMSENDSVFTRELSTMDFYRQKSIDSRQSTGSGPVPQIYVTGCTNEQKNEDRKEDSSSRRAPKTENIEMRKI
uniref:uncharacterized protein LOC120330117 n=1 Tax=Styela clava TaxID=7725 RepID=UPI0019395C88|nr:uncharacterized protein LOC120330117 [Styela clava]